MLSRSANVQIIRVKSFEPGSRKVQVPLGSSRVRSRWAQVRLGSGASPAQARPPQLRRWLAAFCAAVIGDCSCDPSGIVEALWLLPAIPIVPGLGWLSTGQRRRQPAPAPGSSAPAPASQRQRQPAPAPASAGARIPSASASVRIPSTSASTSNSTSTGKSLYQSPLLLSTAQG